MTVAPQQTPRCPTHWYYTDRGVELVRRRPAELLRRGAGPSAEIDASRDGNLIVS